MQTFVPEELLKFLTIINCKKYTWENINDIKINQYRHKEKINYSNPQMYGFPDTEEGKKQLQEFRKQEKERFFIFVCIPNILYSSLANTSVLVYIISGLRKEYQSLNS